MGNKTKGCSDCKLFGMELIDPFFLWYGQTYRKWVCSECGKEEIQPK